MILDTHRFVEELIDAGFEKKQAEVFVNRLNQSSDNLATKADISRLENKMESKITEAKYDMIKFIVPFLFAILLSVLGLWFK